MMRLIALDIAATVLAITGALCVEPGADTMPARIQRLIRQLGDGSFAKRQAASRELEIIGDPALDSLRKAAAADGDPEIRRRARRLVDTLMAGVYKREQEKCAGAWRTSDGVWLKITGDRWKSATPTWGPVAGVMRITDIKDNVMFVDFDVDEGPTKGQTCMAILRRDGDMLRYCGTYAGHYPPEFKGGGSYYESTLRRLKE